MTKTSEIKFNITLDENKVTEQINWSAADGGVENEEAGAILLSVWSPKSQDTLRIDLWQKEFMMDDMKKFIHQTLLSLADTLERATGEEEMAEDLRDFSRYYGEKLGLLKPKG